MICLLLDNTDPVKEAKLKAIISEIQGLGDYEIVNVSPTVAKPSKKSLQQWSAKDFDRYEVVVTFGDRSKEIFGIKENISSVNGKLKVVEGVNVIPNYSPSYLKYDSSILQVFVNNINKAIQLVNGTFKAGIIENEHRIVRSKAALDSLKSYIKAATFICWDAETNALPWYHIDFKMTCMSFTFCAGSSIVVPIEHFEETFFGDLDAWFQWLKVNLFENPDKVLLGHNIKADMLFVRPYGIDNFFCRLEDTMIIHHILNSNTKQGLKFLISLYLPEFSGYDDDIKKNGGFAKCPLKELARYNALDTDLTYRIWHLLINQLDKKEYILYHNLRLPLIKVVYKMEAKGIDYDSEIYENAITDTENQVRLLISKMSSYKKVKKFVKWYNRHLQEKEITKIELEQTEIVSTYKKDVKQIQSNIKEYKKTLPDDLEDLDKETKKGLEKLENSLVTLKSRAQRKLDSRTKKIEGLKDKKKIQSLNFASPDQMSKLIYGKDSDKKAVGFGFKIPFIKGEHKASTNENQLKKFRTAKGSKGEFIEDLLTLRKLNKLLSTYLLGMEKRMRKDEKKIYVDFNIIGTVSGRVSSFFHTMPRGGVYKIVKKYFKPGNGKSWVQLDYSQMELRLAAEFSGDKNMMQVYIEGKDIHSNTAASMVGLSLEDWSSQDKDLKKVQRTGAKGVNFGFVYGMQASSLPEYALNTFGLEVTQDEATDYRNAFFKTYPKLLNWHDESVILAERKGYTTTIFGRKRYLPNLNSQDEWKVRQAANAAINHPVQGAGGQLTVFGMVMADLIYDLTFMNTVHDSVMFEVKKGETTDKNIIQLFQDLPIKQYFDIGLKVPIVVDEAIGDSWGNLVEL